MQFISYYSSPLGKIIMSADCDGLTGIWFEGQKYFPEDLRDFVNSETEILSSAKEWLNVYFSGNEPDFIPPLSLHGTSFRMEVWEKLRHIPYGTITTYGSIARQISAAHGNKNVSAQAVGGAVGRNPVSIIIPCHRVVGADGSLTGYAGGIEKKLFLLRMEGSYS